jgi:hypothetical protein
MSVIKMILKIVMPFQGAQHGLFSSLAIPLILTSIGACTIRKKKEKTGIMMAQS